jgi:hypothetical protein
MPCLGPDEGEYSAELSRDVDKLTRMLCEMCRRADAGKKGMPDGETAKWWKEHQKLDARREREEREERERKETAKKAFGKLSKKEREALGL